MGLVSAAVVRRRLRGLTDEEFREFVGGIWAVRASVTGVSHRGGDIVVERGGRRQTLRPITGRRVPAGTPPTETLVLARPAARVRGAPGHRGAVVDAAELHSMLLYAIPRSSADDLCRRFFDRPLREADPKPRRSVADRLPEQSAPIAAGLLGVLLVVAGVFGAPALVDRDALSLGALDLVGIDPDSPTEEPTADSTGTGATGSTGSEATDSTGTAPTSDAAWASLHSTTYPPGLGPEGIYDANALADGHAKAVTGQSYRLTITYREFVDGRATAYRRETVSVASPTEYRTDLEGAGDTRRTSLVVSSVETYADGTEWHSRGGAPSGLDGWFGVDTPDFRGVQNGEGPNADRVEQYVEWYFSVSESEILDTFERGGVRYYWVGLGDDPYPGIRNSTGSALVDQRGVVHEMRRQYEVPNQEGLTALATIRYTDFGTTTVSPPAWYDEEAHQNATRTETGASGESAAETESATRTENTTVGANGQPTPPVSVRS